MLLERIKEPDNGRQGEWKREKAKKRENGDKTKDERDREGGQGDRKSKS